MQNSNRFPIFWVIGLLCLCRPGFSADTPTKVLPVPLTFSFGNVPTQNDNIERDTKHEYARLRVQVDIDGGGGQKTIQQNIDFDAPNRSFGEYFFTKKALVSRTVIAQTFFWRGFYGPRGNRLLPKPGDKVDVVLEFFPRNGRAVAARPSHKITIYIEYDIKIKVNGKTDKETVKTGVNVAFLTEFEEWEKKGALSANSGFYLFELDANGKIDPTLESIFIKGVKRNPQNTMEAKRPFSRETVYQASSFASVNKLKGENKKLREDVSINSTNKVRLSVVGGDLTIAMSIEKKDYYNIGTPLEIGVSTEFKAGPDDLRQFPEIATLKIQVRKKGQGNQLGPVVSEFNGNVELKEFGSLFVDGAMEFSTILDPAKRVPITNGEATVSLYWVASNNQQNKSSDLRARFEGEQLFRRNPMRGNKPFLTSKWHDLIGIGGGTKLGSGITNGANKVSDWLDAMMFKTRNIIAAGGTDGAKIVNEIKEFKLGGGEGGGLMTSSIKSGIFSLLVNEESPLLRPATNFKPAFEGIAFNRTKTPYGNALTHELRHAYIFRKSSEPNNDVDGDLLPTALNGDVTKKVTFTLDGVANSTVLDPNPTVKDAHDVPLKTTGEAFSQTVKWGKVAGTPEFRPDYGSVYTVGDNKKTPINEEKDFKFEMTLKNGKKYTFTKVGQRIDIPNTVSNIRLSEIGSMTGRIAFAIMFNPQDANAAKIKSTLELFKGAVVVGDFYYSEKGDAGSRLEMDAHTFAQNEEPANN